MKEFQPKRLRIVQKNMEGYTGAIGMHWFENGVSIKDIPYMEAQRIGAMIEVVDATDGHVVNPAEDTLRNMGTSVSSEKVKAYNSGEALKVNPNISAHRLDRAALEAIADKEGLNGVRSVARKWGRTGRSIQECIDAVLSAQAEADVKEGAAPAEDPEVEAKEEADASIEAAVEDQVQKTEIEEV